MPGLREKALAAALVNRLPPIEESVGLWARAGRWKDGMRHRRLLTRPLALLLAPAMAV